MATWMERRESSFPSDELCPGKCAFVMLFAHRSMSPQPGPNNPFLIAVAVGLKRSELVRAQGLICGRGISLKMYPVWLAPGSLPFHVKTIFGGFTCSLLASSFLLLFDRNGAFHFPTWFIRFWTHFSLACISPGRWGKNEVISSPFSSRLSSLSVYSCEYIDVTQGKHTSRAHEKRRLGIFTAELNWWQF